MLCRCGASACGPLAPQTRSSARRAARRAASGAPVAGVLLVGLVDGARSSRSAPREEGCTLQQVEPRARDTRRAAPPRPRHAAPQPARTTSDTSAVRVRTCGRAPHVGYPRPAPPQDPLRNALLRLRVPARGGGMPGKGSPLHRRPLQSGSGPTRRYGAPDRSCPLTGSVRPGQR